MDACCTAGLLPELEALGGVLEAVPDWKGDASAIRARMLRILSLVAARYNTCGEALHQSADCVRFLTVSGGGV